MTSRSVCLVNVYSTVHSAFGNILLNFRKMDIEVCCREMHYITIRTLSPSVTRKVLSSDDVTQRGEATCHICCKGYKNGDVTRSLPACGHVFHEKCLWRAIKQSSTCPKCTKSVDPDSVCEVVAKRSLVCSGPSNPMLQQPIFEAPMQMAIVHDKGEPTLTLVVQKFGSAVTRRRLSADNVRELEGDDRKCGVCRVHFRPSQVTRALPACGHAFHERCLWKRLEAKVSCPLCTTTVDPSLLLVEILGYRQYP